MTMLSPVEVDVPGDLAAALSERVNARDAFDNLPRSHQQDIIAWVTGATDERHRAERVRIVVDILLPSM
jgi:uncharacterized protein YdeI (YjbR/CyaY-like superfamily)